MPDTSGELSFPKDREREIFLAALELETPAERAAFVTQACAGDEALQREVEALLRNHKEDDFMERPVIAFPHFGDGAKSDASTTRPNPVIEKAGDRIGRYRLLQEIGEGGCGVVYMAEQESPIRRRVALKVIKLGMDTKNVIARFEAERQALALMDHPNIARVLDAGATQTGRPYFVMELVRGIKITDYCDQNHLGTRERLYLFIKVCQAVQHAHQKGIIHRDLKPSNILVTLHDSVAVPKVIDFGVAKATDQRLTDKTLVTDFRSFVGTPAYTSPEQAEMSGLDIDTRGDIYSLGVLLYELLTGTTPFDSKQLLASGIDEMRRTIREKDPLPPSTRLRTFQDAELARAARQQQAEPARLVGMVAGDLDWIVMKCLEKDRTRRYGTASELAADVLRHLNNEPITAHPPSRFYQFQKFIRRNKLIFVAGSSFGIALVFGLALSLWQSVEKSRAYRRALAAEQTESILRQEAEKTRLEAETQALAAKRKSYAADINLVQQALLANNLGRAQELLNGQRPQPGQPDLRGWEWRYLWQHCQGDQLFTLCQLSNTVSSLAVSPDGRWLAAGEFPEAGISVWDLRARREIERVPMSGGRDAKMVFSPVDPVLAFSSEEWQDGGPRNRIHLWDAVARKTVLEIPAGGRVLELAFSPDGRTFLSACLPGRVVFWNAADGKKMREIATPGLDWRESCFRVSRDLTLAAHSIGGGRIRVVNLNTGAELWTAKAADELVRALAFSPDGRVLASGAGFVESAVRLWDVATGREITRLNGHRTWVSSLVFWPDGKTLASGGADQTIRLWDLTGITDAPRNSSKGGSKPVAGSQESGSRLKTTLRGHKREVWSLALLPDKTTLVSGSKDGSVYVWDTTTLPRERTHVTLPESVRDWRFAGDGKSILAWDRRGEVVSWVGNGFQERKQRMELEGNLVRVCLSPDGRYVAASDERGATKVWDLEQKIVAREFEKSFAVIFMNRPNNLVTFDFDDQNYHEWDPSTWKQVGEWSGGRENGQKSTPGFSPDGLWFLSLNNTGRGSLRNLVSGRETVVPAILEDKREAVISPDGGLIAVITAGATATLWETATGRKIASLHGFLQDMHSMTFSPDSHRLAIGGDGNEAIKMWDVNSLQELLTLEGSGSFFRSVSFSPDGNRIAAHNLQGIVHIWSAPSFEEIDRAEAETR